MGGEINALCTRTQRLNESQDKSGGGPYQAPAHLFQPGRSCGPAAYFLTRGAIGNSASVLLMIGLMMPFFFFAMYERDGQPAEKILKNRLRYKLWPKDVRTGRITCINLCQRRRLQRLPKTSSRKLRKSVCKKTSGRPKKTGADAKQGKTKSARSKPSKKGGFLPG